MKKLLTIALLVVMTASGLAQAKKHCGPRKVTIPTTKSVNEGCKKHDSAYDKKKGLRKYIPGFGSKQIQTADRNLVKDMSKAKKSGKAGRSGKYIRAYFQGKGIADRAADRARSRVKKAVSAGRKVIDAAKSMAAKLARARRKAAARLRARLHQRVLRNKKRK